MKGETERKKKKKKKLGELLCVSVTNYFAVSFYYIFVVVSLLLF